MKPTDYSSSVTRSLTEVDVVVVVHPRQSLHDSKHSSISVGYLALLLSHLLVCAFVRLLAHFLSL